MSGYPNNQELAKLATSTGSLIGLPRSMANIICTSFGRKQGDISLSRNYDQMYTSATNYEAIKSHILRASD
jgi:hypothetical protein